MNLEEFREKEKLLQDITLELLQAQKIAEDLRLEHMELFKELRSESRFLKIKVVDGQFIQS